MNLAKEQFVHQSVEQSRMEGQTGRTPLTLVRVLLRMLMLCLAIGSIGLAYLIYPATPARSDRTISDGVQTRSAAHYSCRLGNCHEPPLGSPTSV